MARCASLSFAGLALPCLASCLASCRAPAPAQEHEPHRAIARLAAERVLADEDLDDVAGRAEALLRTGLQAGSGYPEVWIRDWATFMALSCRVDDPAYLREGLLTLLEFQRADGDIPDGVGHHDPEGEASSDPRAPLVTEILSWREVIHDPRVVDSTAFKNSVETDQESSLIQAVHTYVERTGDASILDAEVEGVSVRERMRKAVRFLLTERWSDEYGLVYGATTIDWGDIAPEDAVGAVFHYGHDAKDAIDVYDNAMFVIALDDLADMDPADARRWSRLAGDVRAHVRQHLWDAEHQKFVPHLYLDGSPFPAGFDENGIWYEGGTAVAILAGILADDEVRASLQAMRLNVAQTRGRTLGVTNYPTYPAGSFENDHVLPGVYQNGGDWDWFGGRMVQALIDRDMGAEAYIALLPMVHRVQRHDGFFEWFDANDQPQGSGAFRGSAGVLWQAIRMLQAWAREHARA